jgi:enoyl-CoA hydratase
LPDCDPVSIVAGARSRLADSDAIKSECLNAIAAAAEAPDFDAGMAAVRAIYDRLVSSDEVSRQRDRFFESRLDGPA